MSKDALRSSVWVFGSIVAGLLLTAPATAQTVTAVPALEMNRFTGTWYEVARLPAKREKECDRNSIVLIALGDKSRSFQLLNACQVKKGYTDASNQDGKAADKTGSGRLKLGSFWPFYRKYWVLALGPDYAWALIGSPNHKGLWILSRSATLKPEVLAEVEAKATAQGFSLAKLIVPPQDSRYIASSTQPAATVKSP